MNRIDAVTGTRMLIENAFSHLTWHEDACKHLGFKGISQVWKEEPAWYFWLSKTPGAFLLRLHGEEPVAESQYVSLALHYYPALEQVETLALSRGETDLRNDATVFDQPTCTPRYEQFEACLPHFITAEIGLMIGANNQLQVLVFSTGQDRTHPVFAFIDLLVSSLNFEAKTHHLEACHLDDEATSSLLLAYDAKAFKTFQNTFGLDAAALAEPQDPEHLATWRHCAHMDISCSVNGTCSCH